MTDRKKAIILSYMTLVINMLVSLVVTPVIISMLGKSEHGLYSLVNTIIGYFTVMDFGIGSTVIRYTAKYREAHDKAAEAKLYGNILKSYLIIGIIAFLGGMIIATFSSRIFAGSLTGDQTSRIWLLLVIASVNIGLYFPFNLFYSAIVGYEKYMFAKILDFVYKILQPLLLIGVIFAGQGVLGMILTTVILTWAISIVRIVYCIRKLHIHICLRNQDKLLKKELFSFSVFIFIAQIIDKLFWNTDMFILGIVGTSTDDVSVYAYGFTYVSMFITFTSVIGQLYLPQFTRMAERGGNDAELSSEFVRISRLQFFLCAFIYLSFLLIGKTFIITILGAGYTESYYVALYIMSGLVLGISQNVGVYVLQAKNMHRFRAVVQLIIAVINVVLTVFFAKQWGPVGAALATLIAQLFGVFVIMSIYYQKKARLNVLGLLKSLLSHILMASILTGICFGLFYLLKPLVGNVWVMFIVAAVFTLAYWGLTVMLTMNVQERSMVTGTVHSMLKRRKIA